MEATILVTDAGLQEVVNAEKNGTAPVLLTEVGFGDAQYEPTHNQTALKGEFKRVPANKLSGGNVGDNTIYINARDDSNDAYTLFEFGVYTASGTLFAVCSQTVPILQKAAGAQAYLDIEFLLSNVNPASVALGDTNFFNPPATHTTQGVTQYATPNETIEGSRNDRAITPAALSARTASEERSGLAQFATAAETQAGSINTKAVTPSGLAAAFPKTHAETGVQKLPNGLIMQWGKALIDPSGTQVVFPSAFPNKCTHVSATATGSITPAFSVKEIDTGKVSLVHNGNGGVSTFWLAVGY